MKVVKDGKIIEVTEKAYRVVYKGLGYKPYQEHEEETEAEENNVAEEVNGDVIDYKSMKVDELRELAKARDIEGYSKMKKDELVAALRGD